MQPWPGPLADQEPQEALWLLPCMQDYLNGGVKERGREKEREREGEEGEGEKKDERKRKGGGKRVKESEVEGQRVGMDNRPLAQTIGHNS